MKIAKLFKMVERKPLGVSIPTLLRLVENANTPEFATWLRLELLGYVAANPVMTEEVTVPEYRSVSGRWFDAYNRPLLLTDPSLSFIEETRVRSGIHELESFARSKGTIAVQVPAHSELIREHLDVEVSTFRFNTSAVPQVLANIKAHLLDRLVQNQDSLERVTNSSTAAPQSDEIIELRPNVAGIGVNLRALWKKLNSGAEED